MSSVGRTLGLAVAPASRPVLLLALALLAPALLALALLGWSAGPSWAGPDPAKPERRVALVLGNSGYQHAPRLPNPVNDARAIADSLRSAGFELVGGGARLDLDRAGTERAIRDFGGKLAGADVGLFYYAGHGLQMRGTNYLLPVSANLTKEADVRYELIDIEMVLDEMALAESRLNIVILDACRNNPFGGRGLRSVSPGLAQMQAPAGTIIAYATQPGAVAADGQGSNSPYTEALATALLKPGETVFDVFNDVGLAVKRTTGGVQQPWVSASPIEGRFYFLGPTTVVTPAPAPAGADKEALFWDSIKASSNRKMFEAYLKQFPQGTFAAIAEARIAELGGQDAAAPIAAPVAAAPMAAAPVAATPPAETPAPAAAQTAAQTAAARTPAPAPPPALPVDPATIPRVSAKARAALANYPTLPSPKALAISERGGYAYFTNRAGGRTEEDVKRAALQFCQHQAKAPCTLYAVGDSVVPASGKEFVPMPVEIAGSGAFDPARVPFVTDRTREVGMVNYQRNPGNKALAVTLTGRWGAAWNRGSAKDARAAALEKCAQLSGDEECMLYAVNDRIVFDETQTALDAER
ncbi:putative caspase-like protein [Azospirillum agricola]|nr:caspase family protein [Azospirillum agricola]MBP2228629.1 putative caspase-like protein [Azospirillum agricola]